MLIVSVSAFAQSSGTPLRGDVNEDGVVDVADINTIIAIMKNVQEHYFYLGTIKPTAENYKVIPGTTTSFTTLDEAIGTTVPVDAGQTLYMLCPAEWLVGNLVAIKDNSGETVSFSEDVDDTTVMGYVICKTQAWSVSSDATLITNQSVVEPMVELQLGTYWNYDYVVSYDWQSEWYYGWDDIDRTIWGEMGYTAPTSFQLRCYYTGDTPMGTPFSTFPSFLSGSTFYGIWEFGYWDILAWNEAESPDGISSLCISETPESVTAYTNRSMRYAYEPEQLFAASSRAIEISQDFSGFEYDVEKNTLVKRLQMVLKPVTYIYLPQVILHNNRNRITGIDGLATLSGLARTTNLNTGITGEDAVAVGFNMRMKTHVDMNGETIDIVGGRMMTFGMCGQNINRVQRPDDVKDVENHYLEMEMQFNNGMEQTFKFDVTDQVRKHYKGGVITIELDVDTISAPSRS